MSKNEAFSVTSLQRFPLTRTALGLWLALGLAACQSPLRSDYQRPLMPLPSHWQQAAHPREGQADWTAFADPALDQLIEQVLSQNADLVTAGIKLRKAQLQLQLIRHQQGLNWSAELATSRSHDLSGQGMSDSSSANLGLSYELDLWGKLDAARDEAQWELEATAEDRAATALSLVGSAAQAYWQLGYLNELIGLAQANVEDSLRVQQLVDQQYLAGAVSGLDRVTAAQSVVSQEASLYTYRQQRVEARNALALLLDRPPEQWQAEPRQLSDKTIPRLPADLPAQLLARRPDLRASEYRLRESLAAVDNQRLSLYPSFTLTGALGTASSALWRFSQDPVGTLGAGLSLPFVNWQQGQVNIALARQDYAEAVVGFRQDLFTALSEVENALAAQQHYAQQGERLQQALTLAEAGERLAEQRYRLGAEDLSTWLEQRKSRREAQQSLLENHYNRLLNQMTLYQALGTSPRLTHWLASHPAS
ncbi:MAG: efflux transporter outer membrane subunit [Aeromonadaceae bacterium]|nr:efflux transporter outer membrane subunit [Aeromonadaceae bacterium]